MAPRQSHTRLYLQHTHARTHTHTEQVPVAMVTQYIHYPELQNVGGRFRHVLLTRWRRWATTTEGGLTLSKKTSYVDFNSAIPWNGDASTALTSLNVQRQRDAFSSPALTRSDSTVRPRKPAGAKMCCGETAEYSVCDGWSDWDVGDRRVETLETDTQQCARYFGAWYRRLICG